MASSKKAPSIEAVGMTMQFGDFTALDNVTMKVRSGSFHALLGENGAGKSTLVKCIMGFNRATSGGLLVDNQEVHVADPRHAQSYGLGMVYQHFTLVPSLTALENLVISRGDAPHMIDWQAERQRLENFVAEMPFSVALDRKVETLAAGEKQKLEILKQLYLGSRFLILDEPTSVLTPDEADEVLGHVKSLTDRGELSVLIITHKFREVRAYADAVTVLRRGRVTGSGLVADLENDDMAKMMMGQLQTRKAPPRTGIPGDPVLQLRDVRARDGSGLKNIVLDDLAVRSGEIVGVAGISGNGQVELIQILTGQRRLEAGRMTVNNMPYANKRQEARQHAVRYLPEEPLQSACAPKMTVAQNLALRDFDLTPDKKTRFWFDRRRMKRRAEDLIEGFDIRTQGPDAQIRTLSGGNVQRAALARELSGDVSVLIVANPCFGLDFVAAQSIRDRLMEARNAGVAVLLVSEDLDEILELSDRVLVMSEGRITYETTAASAVPAQLGHYMAGHAS